MASSIASWLAGVALWTGMAAACAAEPQSFAWPGGARVAVSLGYDDALASQLDIALPALDQRGLHASFYLTLASDTVRLRLSEWRAAALRGHELGNHSLFHPCSRSAAPGREWVAPHRDLDRMSPLALREEVLLANSFLQAIDGCSERTYTVPCGDLVASGEAFVPALREAFVAIKSRGGSGITADITTQDPHDLQTAGPVDASGEALIALVSRAADESQGRTLVSFTFHGIGGDYLAVSADAHARLLDHLAAHPGRYWVENFVTIMRWVRAAKSGAAH